ncbi:putative chorismate mutase [Collimonas arenae]|uniref:chorismate mutase n=1 Tax=Collimonas arenae TaxID=279058 RepID=A0A127PPZ7_9BURK|nr:gamma subclass chorismate mutase AroQ [Collimonas arenae]AMO99880.1 putative chorismate mutase [Collimonas arenae]AMP09777.1 putative chorismate mutase [Collimonas arenae]
MKNVNKQILGQFGRWLAIVLLAALAACQSVPPSLTIADSEQIDQLLILIDQRLAVAPQVAKAKWNSGAAINDPPREKLILEDVVTQADGLDPAFVRKFFQAQFDASKALQQELQDQWRAEGRDKFDQVADLGRDVRPVLDKLTPQLITALHRTRSLLNRPGTRDYIETRSLQLVRGDIDGKPRRIALLGLGVK